MKRAPARWKRKVAVATLSVLSGLVLLEVTIRVYDAARGFGFFSARRNVVATGVQPPRPFRTFGFDLYARRDGVRHVSSRHGELYPLEREPGTLRIVVFGGSSSENRRAFLEAGIHFPLVLQERLRTTLGRADVEVINVAYEAYSTAHSLILLELDVLSWEPDVIIVSHNVNDLLAAYWPDFAFDYSNKYANRFYSLPDLESIYSAPNVLLQHSQLYWLVKDALTAPQVTAIRRESYGVALPSEVTDVFARNLRSIVALAQANGIDVVLGSQPLEVSEEAFLRHMRYKPYNGLFLYPLHEEFVAHHGTFNEIIANVARDTGVRFCDAAGALAGEPGVFIDFVHYTEAGVRALADAYAGCVGDLAQSLLERR